MGLRIKFSIRTVLLLITLVAVFLAFQTRAIRQHNEAAARLRESGGQFDFEPITFKRWITGTIPAIEELKFFGPTVDDDVIDDIVDVASTFGSRRVSLIETLITPQGERELKTRLPKTQFQIVTLGVDSPRVIPRR